MMVPKKAILVLTAALVLMAGCVTTSQHTYTDKKKVKLTVPGCV
jgi:predicted component of type VI protein secretion system